MSNFSTQDAYELIITTAKQKFSSYKSDYKKDIYGNFEQLPQQAKDNALFEAALTAMKPKNKTIFKIPKLKSTLDTRLKSFLKGEYLYNNLMLKKIDVDTYDIDTDDFYQKLQEDQSTETTQKKEKNEQQLEKWRGLPKQFVVQNFHKDKEAFKKSDIFKKILTSAKNRADLFLLRKNGSKETSHYYTTIYHFIFAGNIQPDSTSLDNIFHAHAYIQSLDDSKRAALKEQVKQKFQEYSDNYQNTLQAHNSNSYYQDNFDYTDFNKTKANSRNQKIDMIFKNATS